MTTQERDDKVSGINPTVAFITICSLIGLAIGGATIIILVNPEAIATFSNNIVVLLGIAVSFAGTVGIVAPIARKTSRVEKDVAKVKTQTNGTLSKLLAREREYVHLLNTHGIEIPKGNE
ncbi:membrane protein [Microbacterium phage Curie]